MTSPKKPGHWWKAAVGLLSLVLTSSIIFPFLEKLAEEHGVFRHPTNRVVQIAKTAITAIGWFLDFLARHYGVLIALAIGFAAGLALGALYSSTVLRGISILWHTVRGRSGDHTVADFIAALKVEAVGSAAGAADGTVLLNALATSVAIPADATTFQRRSLARLAFDELIADGLATDPTGRGEVLKLNPGAIARQSLAGRAGPLA